MGRYKVSVILRVVVAIFLILALGNYPYGFYTLLRWFVTITALYTGYLFSKVGGHGWAWVLFITAVLFNPLAPVYMDKSTWHVVDILVAGIFLFSLSRKEIKDAD